MKALVDGAGAAGTAAAMSLRKVGWDVQMFDAYGRSSGTRLVSDSRGGWLERTM